MSTPADLIGVREAAQLVDKSVSTIRRWLRYDRLTRYKGDAPTSGGHASTLVSQAQLLAVAGRMAVEHPPAPGEPVQATTVDTSTAVRVAELQGEVSPLRAQLDAMTGAQERERAQYEDRLRQGRADLESARMDVADWRDRHDAIAAELAELRARAGRPWWRALLAG